MADLTLASLCSSEIIYYTGEEPMHLDWADPRSRESQNMSVQVDHAPRRRKTLSWLNAGCWPLQYVLCRVHGRMAWLFSPPSSSAQPSTYMSVRLETQPPSPSLWDNKLALFVLLHKVQHLLEIIHEQQCPLSDTAKSITIGQPVKPR